jgi:hypothetical protein
MANAVNSGSYAQYEDLDSFSYLAIKYMLDNDELIWKLLYYNTPDAWNKSNLTASQKTSLIYKGEDDTSSFRVFMDTGQPDSEKNEISIVRIHPYTINPNNRVWGSVTLMFEVYAHYKINHLSNYKTRNDMILQRFISLFNGTTIGGIGKLHFDVMGTLGVRAETVGQLPFRGKWLMMGNKIS